MKGFKNIASGIILFHGQSAAGKGDSGLQLKALSEQKGDKLISLSSGDCYRVVSGKIEALRKAGTLDQLSDEERDVAEFMASGSQVPTLQPVMPALIDGLYEYIVDRLNGKNTRIILDGFLRNGEDTFNDSRVPSQILQVSEGIIRAMKKVIDEEPDLVVRAIREGRIDLEVVERFIDEEKVDYRSLLEEGVVAEVAESIRKDSSHVLVDVLPEDAETLMRYRSYKAIHRKVIPALEVINSNMPDDKVTNLLVDMNELDLLQSGKYTYHDGRIDLDNSLEDRSLMPLDMNDDGFVSAVDKKLKDIAVSICNHLDVEIPEGADKTSHLIAFAFKKLKAEEILPDEYLPRVDDLPLASRKTRSELFENVVKKKVLEGELGIKLREVSREEGFVQLDLSETRTSRDNVTLIVNGTEATRGITYDEFLRRASEGGSEVFQRTGLGIEGTPVRVESK